MEEKQHILSPTLSPILSANFRDKPLYPHSNRRSAMASNLLRQARRIPVECYPILGVVAFSLSAGVRAPSTWPRLATRSRTLADALSFTRTPAGLDHDTHLARHA